VNRIIATLHRRAVLLKQVGALLAVVLVLMLSMLVVSPAAHERLHNDAGQAEHGCAVTLFAHGATPAVTGVALAVVVWRLLMRAPVGCEVFVQTPGFSLLPGRAPPVC
jgi:hypothetical protein